MKYIFIAFLLCLSVLTNSQTKNEKDEAVKLAMEAIRLMDEESDFKEAIKLLEQAQKLDPNRIDYPYEIAYAHYALKEYDDAIKILKKLAKRKDATMRVFQMLGNTYDVKNDPDKAIETYNIGLSKFPESGLLYTELGVVEYLRKNYNNAIDYWEKGVVVEPTYPSNYYWLGKIFSQSEERIWSVLYGEVFMNLERNSKRTVEMSEILFNTYKASISVKSDTSGGVSFSKVMVINASKEFKVPFQMTFGLMMTMSLPLGDVHKEENLSISSINKLRNNFISNWYTNKRDKDYPNILLDYLNVLKKKDYLEAYNYWFLMKGDEEGFSQWYTVNRETFDAFVEWYNENPIKIDKKNYFHRNKY